ncbi:hypothetical protein SD81_002095 [Tolypothrix campylonemoides VB511288]|nr:hypothetical protein SD81_002095 [Tolypothrix campylonemoides VB511288]
MKTDENALLTSCTSSGTFMSIDARLEQLVIQAQCYAPQSQERQLALTRLVDEILRSRKVARPFVGQPLFSIYKKIYEQVRQKLLHNINEEFDNYDPTLFPVRAWSNNLRQRALKKILDDNQLKNLAIEAQRYPPNTELRQYALGELVEAIRLSGRLAHPHQKKFSSPQFYELLYDEAVNKTLAYICRKIDTYDPERGDKKFMNWVNFRLDRVILELFVEFNEPNVKKLPSISDLERIVQQEKPLSLFDIVRETIEEDAENLFKTAYIKNRPDANFQAIALARFSGKTWEEISAELKISVSSLSVFYLRCCEKFRSRLQQ